MNSDTPRTNEEIIDAAHCAECGYEVVLADAMRKLEREIVELGKERDALEAQCNLLAESVQNENNAHMEALRAGQLLEEENNQLKRELAEAREQMDTFINQWSETNNSLQRENLALSLAYQRQKDALSEIGAICRASQDNPGDEDVDWFAEIENRTQAALAETPNVSLWQPISSAPKDGTMVLLLREKDAMVGYWGSIDWPRGSGMEVKDSAMWRMYFENFGIGEPSHWMPLPPPPTLQPDHQK